MKSSMTRREFLAAAAVSAAALAMSQRAEARPFKTKLYKSLIGKPTEETLASWKKVGFTGMETNAWNVSSDEAAKARELAAKQGMKIHSVLRGWTNFNSPKPDLVEQDIASVEKALKAAQGYGADAVLLVPCRIGGMPMPEPWAFDIEFDEKTGHAKKVAAGDNSQYDKYIAAHNHATDTSRAAVRKLIPAAEKAGVVIALENVWNNLWVKPAIFQNFVASFDSPWVQAYFDIGNHVKYAPAQEWIRVLGKLIVKCHVKDFKLKPDGHGGKFCDIRDGSVDWQAVRAQLEAIGYSGWMTIEGSGALSLEQKNRRLDLIIAGK
jgi:L-ribulose-5-phosphate 3-epimerase